jgi:hypothetical protein
MTARVQRRAALAAIACMALLPLAHAQDPRASEAQAAARAWLAIADRLDAEASYEAAGASFRKALTPVRWNDAVKLVRFPLGAVVQRTVNQTVFTKKLPGQPDGDYALIAFRTSWANKAVGRELLTLERADGKWQVAGYVIQ